jgi:hypothetical protein
MGRSAEFDHREYSTETDFLPAEPNLALKLYPGETYCELGLGANRPFARIYFDGENVVVQSYETGQERGFASNYMYFEIGTDKEPFNQAFFGSQIGMMVSGRHCGVHVGTDSDGIKTVNIEDLGSSNGTLRRVHSSDKKQTGTFDSGDEGLDEILNEDLGGYLFVIPPGQKVHLPFLEGQRPGGYDVIDLDNPFAGSQPVAHIINSAPSSSVGTTAYIHPKFGPGAGGMDCVQFGKTIGLEVPGNPSGETRSRVWRALDRLADIPDTNSALSLKMTGNPAQPDVTNLGDREVTIRLCPQWRPSHSR